MTQRLPYAPPDAAAGVCDAQHRQPARELIELVRPAACRTGDAAAGLPPATPFEGWTGQQGTAAMDDRTSDLNERLIASCRETLQQLDDIEAKLAGLHAAIDVAPVLPTRRGVRRLRGSSWPRWRTCGAGSRSPGGGRTSERAGRAKGIGFRAFASGPAGP